MPIKRLYNALGRVVPSRFRKYARKLNIGPQVGRAARKMARGYGGAVATLFDREGPDSAITGQHDSKMLYKRKRAPKGVRRRARRRAQYFLKRQLKNKSSNTNLFTDYQTKSAPVDTQGFFSIVSGYTWCGAGTTGSDRVGSIYEVCQNIEGANPVDIAKDWYLVGMSTDYTITNTSSGSVEIDVYEFVYRKDLFYEDTTVAGTQWWVEEKHQEESKLAGATLKGTPNDLGWVPTDANKAMSHVVIKSKQRFYIAANNAISFTKRTRFNRPVKYTSSDFESSSNANNLNIMEAKRGVTRGIFVIHKGLPNATNAAGANSLAFNAQTRYTVKQVDRQDDKTAINY